MNNEQEICFVSRVRVLYFPHKLPQVADVKQSQQCVAAAGTDSFNNGVNEDEAMGQVSSSVNVSKRSREQPSRSRSLSNITHRDILERIQELNKITHSLAGRNDKILRFVIKDGTNRSSFAWKRKIKIQCQKMDTLTQMIVSCRTLTLRQFLDIHQEITQWVAALTIHFVANVTNKKSEHAGVAASEEEISLEFSSVSTKSKEAECCCVCMERRACIMLSCCHEFCEVCIDNWTRDEEHSNCPLCRTSVSGSDDTWVLMDKADAKDHTSDVHSYLMRIADRRGDLVS